MRLLKCKSLPMLLMARTTTNLIYGESKLASIYYLYTFADLYSKWPRMTIKTRITLMEVMKKIVLTTQLSTILHMHHGNGTMIVLKTLNTYKVYVK